MTTIEKPPRSFFGRRRRPSAPRASALQVTNLTFRDTSGGQQRTILDRANLSVAAGSKVCVVGASTSDQTALLGLLLGLDRPLAGSGPIDGQHVAGDHGSLAGLDRLRGIQLIPGKNDLVGPFIRRG